MPTATTPAPDFKETVEQIFSQPFSWEKVLYTVLLFAVCLVVMKVLTTLLDRAIKHLGVEKTLHTFIKSSVRILLWFVTVILVLGYLNVDMTSMIAILSVAGLAVSLAIQGTLSNLAGGIMVLVSKPFKVGDYIQAGGVEGTVADIAMVYTRIKTFDNKLIFVPNGEISKEKIVNYTSQELRRVDLTFSAAYGASPQQVKDIMHAAIGRNNKTLFTPEPFVRMTKIKDSSVDYTLRVWCATEDYWQVYYDLLEALWDDFAKAGVDLTYNHLNVHIMDQETGLEGGTPSGEKTNHSR